MTHSLAARITTDHLRACLAADGTGRHLHAVPGAPGPVLSEAPRPAPIQVPATARVGAIARVDAQLRVSVVGALRDLDWDAGTRLLIELTGTGQAELRRFDPDQQQPHQLPELLDWSRWVTIEDVLRLGCAPAWHVRGRYLARSSASA